MKDAIQQVVIIGSVWPEPRSSAAGANMLALIKLFLSEHWRVTFASPAQPGETRADLVVLGVIEQTIKLNCGSFDTWIVEQSPDMVVFDRFMMEEQFGWRVAQYCPDALRVLDTEDLHCLRDVRQRMLKSAQDTQHRLPQHAQGVLEQALRQSELAQREVAAIYRSDLSLVLSDVEIMLLQNTFGVSGELLHHCPFMLQLPELQSWSDFTERQDFMCIGNFLHAPNLDAVFWLKEQIWPLIRARLPAARIKIYGAYMPQKARELHQPAQGFEMMGWADDAMAVMQQARVCLAPLRFGAGIKGKLAEAMVCGTPSVTTTIGAEGMRGNLTWSGIVADETIQFADAAIQLHEDTDAWEKARLDGLAILQQNFDARIIGPALIARLNKLKADVISHRSKNFTGAMLRHHQHKSTEYMARWIESKNRLLEMIEENKK